MSKKGRIDIEKNIIAHFDQNGENIGTEEATAMIIDPPEEAMFPILMFTAAMFKDILDAFTLTGVGHVLSLAASFVIGIAIFLWLLDKGGGGWKIKLIRKLLVRFGLVIVLEVIPGMNLIPIYSIFIVMTYYREKKIVILFWQAAEIVNIKKDLEKGVFHAIRGKAKRKFRGSVKETGRMALHHTLNIEGRREEVRKQRRARRSLAMRNQPLTVDGVTRLKPAWQN